MWREYLGYAGAAIAVLNGLIAGFVALLSTRRSVLKLRLAVVALVLGGLAVGAVVYGRYHASAQQERRLADRREIKERIENFILEGRTVLAQIKDSQRELPSRPADEWAHRTETYLGEKLGEEIGRAHV